METDGKHDEMLIGTMIRVGDVWRLIDTPRLSADSELMAGGFFFQPAETGTRPGLADQKSSDAGQKYLVELEKVDQQLQKSDLDRRPGKAERADGPNCSKKSPRVRRPAKTAKSGTGRQPT